MLQRVPTRKCKSVGAAGDLLGVLFVNYIFIASRSIIGPRLKSIEIEEMRIVDVDAVIDSDPW